jgi:hypothetical protein
VKGWKWTEINGWRERGRSKEETGNERTKRTNKTDDEGGGIVRMRPGLGLRLRWLGLDRRVGGWMKYDSFWGRASLSS